MGCATAPSASGVALAHSRHSMAQFLLTASSFEIRAYSAEFASLLHVTAHSSFSTDCVQIAIADPSHSRPEEVDLVVRSQVTEVTHPLEVPNRGHRSRPQRRMNRLSTAAHLGCQSLHMHIIGIRTNRKTGAVERFAGHRVAFKFKGLLSRTLWYRSDVLEHRS